MAVLVIADHDNATLKDNTEKTVTAALKLSADVDVLVAGKGAKAVADAAAKITGVRKVLLAESDALGEGIAEAMEALVVPLMANYDAVLTPATSQGKNFSPRIAARLDVAQISEILDVVDANTFVRPIYAGNALETVQSADAKKVITVRPTAFKAAADSGSASVEAIPAPAAPAKTHFVGQQLVKSARPELSGAKIVVSGGRAMGSAEEFHKVIEPLADKLGAAVGASRRRLRPQRLPGRPDRQGGGARALYRHRHLRGDPAPGRHEGLQGDRGDQQGRRRADLPGRRLRPGRRLQDRRAGADERPDRRRQVVGPDRAEPIPLSCGERAKRTHRRLTGIAIRRALHAAPQQKFCGSTAPVC
jgi:electron transfer flavoprotein alpha subunit